MPYVYMLRCSDDSLYTGFALDLRRRVAQHNAGKGAKYTRGRRPVRLIWAAELPCERQARRAEVMIKRLPLAQKRLLAAGRLSLWEACPRIWEGENAGERERTQGGGAG